MPFIGLGLHFLVAIFFAVHVIRKGRQMYWLIILFSFPLLGSLVYFLVEFLPASRVDRGLKSVAAIAVKAFDPTREMRAAKDAFDLTPTAQTNGWGPYERNRSNGEQGAADGRTITLNGVTYAKGLGCHAASDLRFNLNAQYQTFLTDIGLDDEVGANGSVVFQVWLDGVKVYDSGVMRGATATKQVTLNVAGKRELRLVVTNGGDNLNYDHADWANARLMR